MKNTQKINRQRGFIQLPILLGVGILAISVLVSAVVISNKDTANNKPTEQALIYNQPTVTPEVLQNIIFSPEPTPTFLYKPTPTLPIEKNTKLVTSTPIPIATQKPPLILYTINQSEIRKCPSISCEVLGTYRAGLQFNFSGDYDISPEWYKVVTIRKDENGNNIVGYMQKSMFQSSQPVISSIATPQITPAQDSIKASLTDLQAALNDWKAKIDKQQDDFINDLRKTWYDCIARYEQEIKAIKKETPEQTWQKEYDRTEALLSNPSITDFTRDVVRKGLVILKNEKEQNMANAGWLQDKRNNRISLVLQAQKSECDFHYRLLAQFTGLPYSNNPSSQSSYIGNYSIYDSYSYYRSKNSNIDPTITYQTMDGRYLGNARLSCIAGGNCGIIVNDSQGRTVDTYQVSCSPSQCAIIQR